MKSTVYILFKTPFVVSRRKLFVYFIIIRRLIQVSTGTIIMLDIYNLNIVFSCYRY